VAPKGKFLAVPARPGRSGGGRAAVGWLKFSAGPGQAVRVPIPPPGPVPTGAAQFSRPTPGKCYVSELAPPAADWFIGAAETGTVELDTAAIMATAAGALPPDSRVLTGVRDRVRRDWRLAAGPERHAAGPDGRAGRPRADGQLHEATAMIENITARQDMVAIQLWGAPGVRRVLADDHTLLPGYRRR
jgi:hypothetical protein